MWDKEKWKEFGKKAGLSVFSGLIVAALSGALFFWLGYEDGHKAGFEAGLAK